MPAFWAIGPAHPYVYANVRSHRPAPPKLNVPIEAKILRSQS